MKFRVLLLLPLCLAACGNDDSSSNESADAVQACVDTATAVAEAYERCGEDYETSYDSFEQTAAGGSCQNVTAVRDEASLRGTCLPSLATVSCSDFLAGMIDPSCEMQLVHP